jgi:16S rRNA processing protein RimM
LIAFEGILSPEMVGEFRNQFVYVKSEDRPQLPKGEYYHHQLLGLSVIDDSGGNLGVLSEILSTGANDVYVVRNEVGQEILLPVIDEVILETNLTRGEIRVHILPGLLSER